MELLQPARMMLPAISAPSAQHMVFFQNPIVFLLYQPFREPTMIPFVKCFCMNGYTHMMGMSATIMPA